MAAVLVRRTFDGIDIDRWHEVPDDQVEAFKVEQELMPGTLLELYVMPKLSA